jgi:TM2 domain-containing membrane protein YozV
MIFIICLIVAIITVIAAFMFEKNDRDFASLISGIIALPTACGTAIMLIVLAMTYIGCPRTEAVWKERYASLNTRIENHMYSYSDKSKLIEEVQKWNEDLSAQEKAQKNIWVAIFNPESIEGLDKIDLTRID